MNNKGNIIYTVYNNKIVYYTGFSYFKPENKTNHDCNCEHCDINKQKLRYHFSEDATKAIHLSSELTTIILLATLNSKKNVLGVPLWIKGYRFYATTDSAIKVVDNSEHYRL